MWLLMPELILRQADAPLRQLRADVAAEVVRLDVRLPRIILNSSAAPRDR